MTDAIASHADGRTGSGRQAYVFDAYGTLFDVHAAVRRHSAAIGPDAQALSDLWRVKQLEYTWVTSLMGQYRDFRALTEDALDFCLARYPGVDKGLRADLLDAYRKLDCFAEVPDVLAALRETGARIAILSNGTPAMLEDAVDAAGIGHLIDEIFSVDPLKIYKTAPAAYALVTSSLRISAPDIAFQSSNRWDIAGAKAFGMTCHWINRSGAPDEYMEFLPDKVLSSLSGLVEAPA
ncbi:haloacid dehalogenase type II [Rhizobium rosettiformans]|uniref:(S)-2-haloacid dehalogenase n=1 Tax=Rhizobium rosettiformans TaxID=1368430 RepID=A0ABX7EVF3_9HYPH|nr:haloacid dehalogenase type II [Rhizobium rosettiformans]QRF52319.1 haloacid dehalogenase type II [Rhizobium rosettiformans]